VKIKLDTGLRIWYNVVVIEENLMKSYIEKSKMLNEIARNTIKNEELRKKRLNDATPAEWDAVFANMLKKSLDTK
jgi:hypothetical protein